MERFSSQILFICLDRDERKCHLAFLIPIDSICWTLTAIDKFKVYAKQFEKYALSIPHTANVPTQSTAVILWGLMRLESQTSGTETDDEQPNYVWRNINLQMVFQGVARSIVHIEHLCSDSATQWLYSNGSQEKLASNHVSEQQHDGENGKIDRWLPAQQCRLKEFTGRVSIHNHPQFALYQSNQNHLCIIGTPVFIDDKLAIYVQEWENQECIKYMSEVLTELHRNHANANDPRKCWNVGDACVAQRNRDGMCYRAEIQQVYANQRKCLVIIQSKKFGQNFVV